MEQAGVGTGLGIGRTRDGIAIETGQGCGDGTGDRLGGRSGGRN